MAGYQSGPGVGTVVGPGAPEERGAVSEILSPATGAGQALILAAVAFAVLLFTVAREGTVFQRIANAAGFVVVISAAGIIGQWAGRTYVLRHPDAPFADGVRFDL